MNDPATACNDLLTPDETDNKIGMRNAFCADAAKSGNLPRRYRLIVML